MQMGSAWKGGNGSAQRGRSVIYDCLVYIFIYLINQS